MNESIPKSKNKFNQFQQLMLPIWDDLFHEFNAPSLLFVAKH